MEMGVAVWDEEESTVEEVESTDVEDYVSVTADESVDVGSTVKV